MVTKRAFAKTGSGQNICEQSFWKTKARFFAGANLTWANESCPVEVRKTHFLRCHLYIKTIILPRQARDKHRESTQKRVAAFFLGLVVLR